MDTFYYIDVICGKDYGNLERLPAKVRKTEGVLLAPLGAWRTDVFTLHAAALGAFQD